MRSMIRKLSLLTVIAGLAGGVIAAGCSNSETPSQENAANVGFNLDVNGVHINNVHAVITGPGGFSLTQDFDFSGSSDDTIKMNLPVGNGYSITLTTDVANCGVTQGFNVVQGMTTNVPLHLNGTGCPGTVPTVLGPVTGTVDVQQSCPTVFTVVGPNAFVGSKITVHGVATGGAADSAATSTYAWSGGTFDSPTAGDTKYNCTSAGPHTLTVTITGTGTFSACSSSAQVTVTCTNPGGGTGGSGGTTGGTTGGVSTGGVSTGGVSTGGVSTGGVSTGGVSTGGVSTGGVSTGGVSTGGVSTGGTTGGTVPVADALTGTTCGSCESAANLCTNFRPCDSFGTAVDSAGRLKADTCREVLACVVRTGCAGVGVEGDCYCGTASGPACDAGNGNGACRAEIERGADSTSPSVIQSSFTATVNGGGKALARVVCLNASSCADSCSVLYAND